MLDHPVDDGADGRRPARRHLRRADRHPHPDRRRARCCRRSGCSGSPRRCRRTCRTRRCCPPSSRRGSAWAWCSRRRRPRCSPTCGQRTRAKASGTNSTLREIGVALGIAVLTAVFTGAGGQLTPTGYVDAAIPAVFVGAAVLLATAIAGCSCPPAGCRARPGPPSAQRIAPRRPTSNSPPRPSRSASSAASAT